MSGITFQWEVDPKFDQQLLRTFLLEEKQISRQALATIKNFGEIQLNGEKVTVRAILRKGDIVKVQFPTEERGVGMEPAQIPLSIVYEDEHVLVINKQANLPTIPSIYHPHESLANGVLFYYDQHNIPCTFHAVNRLDRDTSGLLIVAKHRYAHDLLTKEQKSQKIKRTYLAIVHGHILLDEGIINEPIGRKEGSIIERQVRIDGQHARTNYKVIKYLQEATLVELTLETGRTHQIRVHMAHIGHPLLGDDLYGGLKTNIQRQALHSWKLQFFHPFHKERRSFIVDPPRDMQSLLNEQ